MSGKKKNTPDWLKTVKRFVRKKKMATVGLIFLIFLLFVAIFADVIAPYPMVNGAMQINILHKQEAPFLLLSAEERATAWANGDVFWLGTDNLGYDILTYLIYGCRTSVVICIAVTVISTLISIIIGTTSAVIGGWFDLIVQRFVDAWTCIPGILMTVLMMSMFGNGIVQMILVMGIPAGISGSRMVRATAISVKDSGYVKMAEMLGSGTYWKSIRHVLPNILPVIITQSMGGLSGTIMMEASMNYLGFGVDVGTPSWGYMVTNQGRANMYSAPWICLFPGIMITLMVLAANMFGDGLRDFMDPRLQNGVGTYSTSKIERLSKRYLKKQARRENRRAAKVKAAAEKANP